MKNAEEKLVLAISESFKQYHAHRPIATAICLTDIDEKTDRVKILSTEKLYEKSFARLFNAKLSFSNFISELEAYRDFYISQQNLAR